MKKVRTKTQTLKVEIDGVTITGTTLPLKERARIEEKHTVYRNGQRKPDHFEAGFEIFNRRILSWEPAPLDEEGKPLECNTENKRLIWEFDQDFCGEILSAMNDAFASRKDLAEKNS